MRVAVLGVATAVVMTLATLQHDADAARYEQPADVDISTHSLVVTLLDPYPNAVAAMLRLLRGGHATAPVGFASELGSFALAPELKPIVALPTFAPAEPATEAMLPAVAPEAPLRDAVADAGSGNLLADTKPDLALPGERRGASREKPRSDVSRIAFGAPTLAPLAHTRFCLKYASDCQVHKIKFRGGPIALDAERHRELVRINADVNRAIRPEHVNETVAGEKWLISPRSGDCNDYAVTKRHELLARGWPARALLLAEVVTTWGEHHLVLVVRTRRGDLVADNLNANIRDWSKTPYQWVRIESPVNPMFWAAVESSQPDVVAMAAHDSRL